MRRYASLCVLLLTAAGFFPAADAAARPRRIVSVNMCTDELLLRLADPAAIASITWLSQDPRNANMADRARAFPANHGLAEEVVAFSPDLVVAGVHTTRTTVALLRRLGIPVRDFGIPRNLAEIRDQVREMASLLGEEEHGRELIADIGRRLQQVTARRPESRRRALVLRPNGFTVGRDSLVAEILGAAGYLNLSAELGIEPYSQVPLETVILARADLLILNDTPDGPPSLAHAVLAHPAITRLGERLRLVSLPSRLWTCAGPSVLDAIELLAATVPGPADE